MTDSRFNAAVEIIFYVADQNRATQFYSKLFRKAPDLNVPGMTMFQLREHLRLGLMPYESIVKILQDATPHPSCGNGIPSCELYLVVEDLEAEFQNGILAGAQLVSPPSLRNWGDTACYFSDPDGHIIAFATRP